MPDPDAVLRAARGGGARGSARRDARAHGGAHAARAGGGGGAREILPRWERCSASASSCRRSLVGAARRRERGGEPSSATTSGIARELAEIAASRARSWRASRRARAARGVARRAPAARAARARTRGGGRRCSRRGRSWARSSRGCASAGRRSRPRRRSRRRPTASSREKRAELESVDGAARGEAHRVGARPAGSGDEARGAARPVRRREAAARADRRAGEEGTCPDLRAAARRALSLGARSARRADRDRARGRAVLQGPRIEQLAADAGGCEGARRAAPRTVRGGRRARTAAGEGAARGAGALAARRRPRGEGAAATRSSRASSTRSPPATTRRATPSRAPGARPAHAARRAGDAALDADRARAGAGARAGARAARRSRRSRRASPSLHARRDAAAVLRAGVHRGARASSSARAPRLRAAELTVVADESDAQTPPRRSRSRSSRRRSSPTAQRLLGELTTGTRLHDELDRAFTDLRTDLNFAAAAGAVGARERVPHGADRRPLRRAGARRQYNIIVLEDGVPKPVISGGEEDLANLVLRLAISQMIAERAGQAFSLLVLDEVFGSLDETRRHERGRPAAPAAGSIRAGHSHHAHRERARRARPRHQRALRRGDRDVGGRRQTELASPLALATSSTLARAERPTDGDVARTGAARPVEGPFRARVEDIDELNQVFSDAFTERYRRDGMVGVRVPFLNPTIWRYAIEDAADGAMLWRDERGEIAAFNMVHRPATEGWMGPLAVRTESPGQRHRQGDRDARRRVARSQRGARDRPRDDAAHDGQHRLLLALGFVPGRLTITVTLDAAHGDARAAAARPARRRARGRRDRASAARWCSRSFPGYDFSREIDLTQDLGARRHGAAARRGPRSSGFALCHTAPLVEGRRARGAARAQARAGA